MADVAPSQTVYVSNLVEKVKKEGEYESDDAWCWIPSPSVDARQQREKEKKKQRGEEKNNHHRRPALLRSPPSNVLLLLLPPPLSTANPTQPNPTQTELKRCLHAAFSQFGRILDVVVVRHARTRGQAWVVFSDTAAASDAVRALQGFPMLDARKPMRLTFALGKSDAAAKADGTFKAAQAAARAAARKGRRAGSGRGGEAAAAAAAGGAKQAAAAAAAPAAAPAPDADAPPNSTLFVTNLPETTTDAMLSMLFQQFPGFSRTRMVPAKPGIAFVEFETEVAAGVARSGLRGFKITPEKAMNVEYAKR